MFDFGNLQERSTKGSRKGGTGGGKKGVAYDMRLKQSQKRATFEVHKDFMSKMGFDDGFGFYNAPDGNGNVFALVVKEDHKKCLFFSTAKEGATSKSSNFSGEILMNDLKEAGVVEIINPDNIEDRKPNLQYLTLEKVELNNLPDFIEGAYIFKKGEVSVEEVEGNDTSLDEDEPTLEEVNQEAIPELEESAEVPSSDDDEWS